MSIRVEKIKKTIPSRLDKEMGMGIIHSNKNVYISSIKPDSLAADHFKLRDRIVSINDIPVTSKKQCSELILTASTESEFLVEIERSFTEIKLPDAAKAEADVIPDLHFVPAAPPEEPKKPKKSKKPQFETYEGYLGDEEFAVGNPLDGLNFPAPPDVREILKQRLPQILKDFLHQDKSSKSEKSKKSKKSKWDKAKSPSKITLEDTDDVQTTTIATDVPKNKQLMRTKK